MRTRLSFLEAGRPDACPPRAAATLLCIGSLLQVIACTAFGEVVTVEFELLSSSEGGDLTDETASAQGSSPPGITVQGVIFTPDLCNRPSSEVNRTLQTVELRVVTDAGVQGCPAGTYTYQMIIRRLAFGFYEVRVDHDNNSPDYPPRTVLRDTVEVRFY